MKIGRALLWFYCTLVFGYLVLPIFAIVPLSFNSASFLSYPLAGMSLRWYADVFGQGGWLRAMANSLTIAAGVTLLATPLGTIAALGLARLSSWIKPFIFGMVLGPLVVPTIIVGVAMYYLYARLDLVGSYIGLVLAHTTLAIPLVVIVVHAALKGVDNSLLRAGASLGASPATVFLHVLIPLIAPALVAGAVFAFMTSFDEIVVTLLLADASRKTLPVRMFEGVRDQLSPSITAIATLLIVTSIVLLGTIEWTRRRRH